MKELAEKVLKIVDCGLVKGLGVPEDGQMCVEAAVCKALGEEHSDRPSCVTEEVAQFKVRLNDCMWVDEKSRAAGLREIAVCQLGSKDIDVAAYAALVVTKTLKDVLFPLLADHSTGDETRELCQRLVTLDLNSDEFTQTFDALAKQMPISQFTVVTTGRGGGSFPAEVCMYDHAKLAITRLADKNFGAAMDLAVTAVDIFQIVKRTRGRDDGPLNAIARIGCDALRACGAAGVQAWDELHAS